MKEKLAFAVIPAHRSYELFMERYRSCAEFIELLLGDQMQNRAIKILDVGSGDGYLMYFLQDIKVEMYGIEHNPVRARVCSDLGYCEVAEFDITEETFPWQNNFFDAVIASHVIEHLPDVEQSLQEMDRVLRPGGLLVVGTPTKPPGLAGLMQGFRRLFRYSPGDTQRSYSYISLVKECLSSLQWKNEALIDVRGFRLISARKYLPLEDYRWFYNISTFLGKKLMFFVPEVNVVLQKPTS